MPPTAEIPLQSVSSITAGTSLGENDKREQKPRGAVSRDRASPASTDRSSAPGARRKPGEHRTGAGTGAEAPPATKWPPRPPQRGGAQRSAGARRQGGAAGP